MPIIKLISFIVLIIVTFSGCEQNQPSFHADVSDPVTGISVEYRSGIEYPLDKIVEAYIKVQECMGMAAYPGPNIVIYDSIDGYNGYTYFHPPLIIVHDDGLINDNTIVLHHEMVHYLLLKNGISDYDNSNHLSILFWQCGDRIY